MGKVYCTYLANVIEKKNTHTSHPKVAMVDAHG